jgi:hypothetical protein
MYHFVQPATDGPVNGLKSLDPSAFREQLAYIRRHYTPVSVVELVRSVEAATPLPPQPIVLTFDDGYRGHYRHVFPLLDTLSIPAVFFPVASALLDRRVLDVNKIQCLLAASDVGRLVSAIDLEKKPEGSRKPSDTGRSGGRLRGGTRPPSRTSNAFFSTPCRNRSGGLSSTTCSASSYRTTRPHSRRNST